MAEQQPQRFELKHISRRDFSVKQSSTGTFTNEIIGLSAQIRIADALEFIGGKMAGYEGRVAALEKQVRTLKAANAKLRKEVRDAG